MFRFSAWERRSPELEQKLVIAKMPVNGVEKRVTVLFENKEAVEMYVSDLQTECLLNNIYLGHVTKLHTGASGAFVRFDGRQEGFLPSGRIKNPVFKNSKKTDELRPEDELLVRVENEAVKTKLPGLSAELVLTGNYLVIDNSFSGLHFSRKLTETEKNRLYGWLSDTEQPFGFIVRTAAANASEEAVRAEARLLSEKLYRICRYGVSRPAGTCVYRADPLWAEQFRCLALTDAEAETVTDDAEVFEQLQETAEREGADMAGTRQGIRFYSDSMLRLYRLYNLSSLLEKALSDRIWLKSGASLVIEQTEAFVCIDVNSAKSDRKKPREELFLEINLEAAKEAARQIRLRQLSGTILIDFINMKSREDRERLLQEMRSCTERDPAAVSVIDITPLGIMELTRKKRSRSLKEQLLQ